MAAIIGDGPAESQQRLPIFVYGTLMATPLLAWVLTGSSANASSVLSKRKRAHISGFARHPVIGSDYPALVRATESSIVDGHLVFPNDQAEWNKLDNFEGETYTRTTVEAITEDGTQVEACVHLWAGSGDALSSGEWDFTYFKRQRLEDWLELFGGIEMVG